VSDYEFTVALDLLHDSNVVVTTKDRTKLFDQPEVVSPGSAGAFSTRQHLAEDIDH